MSANPSTLRGTAAITAVAGAALALVFSLVGLSSTRADEASPADRNVALNATPSASFTAGHNNLNAVNNGTHSNSGAPETSYWGTWTATGRPATQTLLYEWVAPVEIQRSVVSFWTDAASGSGNSVTVPQSWGIEYWDVAANTWAPVPGASGFGTARTGTNETTFAPVTTTRLRATFRASPNAGGTLYSALGVSEWEVWGGIAEAAPDAVIEVPDTDVRTTPGTAPELPATLDVVRLGGRITPVSVTWAAIDTVTLTDGASVPVSGTLSGLSEQASAAVWVRPAGTSPIEELDDASVITTVGVRPTLPRAVTATLADGSRDSSVPVTWATVPEAAYASEGVFDVPGTVTGSAIVPTAYVFVQPSDGIEPTETPGPTQPPGPTTPPTAQPSIPAPAVPASVPSASALKAKVKPGRVATGRKTKLKLRLTSGVPTTGNIVVTIERGGSVRWSRSVATTTTRIMLPAQAKSGKVRVRATYAGSPSTASSSTTTSYRVTKR